MKHRHQILGLSAILSSTILLVFITRAVAPKFSFLTQWILVWAAFESTLNFYGLNWGLGRSNRAFFSVFAGGSLVRLISLGVLTYILVALRISPAVPLLSLVAAYFILSIVQLPFISNGLY
jgi:hypothetical protein